MYGSSLTLRQIFIRKQEDTIKSFWDKKFYIPHPTPHMISVTQNMSANNVIPYMKQTDLAAQYQNSHMNNITRT